MSILILVSNGDVQRSFRICSQDQHAQAQHWLRHAQAQLMHAQHWPRTLSRWKQGGRAPPVLYPNSVPRVQERSERSGRSERSERAEQCSEHSRTWWPRWAVGRGICGQDQHADLGYISCCCVGCHHSKPKSKLTSPDFNMLTFGDFG